MVKNKIKERKKNRQINLISKYIFYLKKSDKS